eukprot:COSAG05_NODE_87_length_20404_cov_42.272051_7_plen_151_part_00
MCSVAGYAMPRKVERGEREGKDDRDAEEDEDEDADEDEVEAEDEDEDENEDDEDDDGHKEEREGEFVSVSSQEAAKRTSAGGGSPTPDRNAGASADVMARPDLAAQPLRTPVSPAVMTMSPFGPSPPVGYCAETHDPGLVSVDCRGDGML